jgi:glutathione synthase/RimK-type ligase-like ATP-grasp enzyme
MDAKTSEAPSTIRVALATCRELPQLDADTQWLVTALKKKRVQVAAAVWKDPDVDWAAYDLAVVRSCWDYANRRDEFLAWAARVPHLANPAAVLAWNTNKQYLSDLADSGIPVIPTTWIRPDDQWIPPKQGEWVIKPAVSIASLDTGRYQMGDHAQHKLAAEHVHRLQQARRMIMIQPYMAQVDTEGETALVFLGGEFSHALRKGAILDGPDAGIDRRFLANGGQALQVQRPSTAQLELAERVLDAVPSGRNDLLYARVDLVPADDGSPVLMELELTEPMLYFGQVPEAADRMAAAILAAVLESF